MSDAYIIDGIRTPIGKFRGTLSSVRADDLAAHAIRELLKRNPQLDLNSISDVIFGCANQSGEDSRNVARMSLLLAGLPQSVPGETINRLCASGLSSAVHASRAIKLSEGDIYIAGGVEHMTRAPFVVGKSETAFSTTANMFDTSMGWRFINPKMKELYGVDGMGVTAENLVAKHSISREDQDAFALASQQKAARAQKEGRLAQEIVPIEITQRKKPSILFEHDEFIRSETTLEALSKLRAAFKNDGSVTAGNSSGLNDGACALLLASEQGVKNNSFTPKARIVASHFVGVEPKTMGIGPVEATRGVLEKAELTLDQIDIIELNEAFSAQSLSCLKELGVEYQDPRVNPNGGAIALGHPLGMSGARILLSAAIELQNKNKQYALCTMCVGVGQGIAVIIERV